MNACQNDAVSPRVFSFSSIKLSYLLAAAKIVTVARAVTTYTTTL